MLLALKHQPKRRLPPPSWGILSSALSQAIPDCCFQGVSFKVVFNVLSKQQQKPCCPAKSPSSWAKRCEMKANDCYLCPANVQWWAGEDIRPAVTSLYLSIQAQTQLSLGLSRHHIMAFWYLKRVPDKCIIKATGALWENTGVDSFVSWVNVPSLQDTIQIPREFYSLSKTNPPCAFA